MILFVPSAESANAAGSALTATLGAPKIVPIPAKSGVHWYANDSTFPYLPDAQHQKHITFWVDGVNFRSTGSSLDTMADPSPATAVLGPGASGTWDGDGVWLEQAVRDPNDSSGKIYGFYHAENHTFSGKWSDDERHSTGLAVSTDDGATWTKKGMIIGNAPASTPSVGGNEANTVFWDPVNKRWLGIGGGSGYTSSDPDAAPGTWKGWNGSGFNVKFPTATTDWTLPALPGLDKNMSGGMVTWNTYLKRFVIVYQNNGDQTHVYAKTSADGVHWDTVRQTLLTVSSPQTVGYAQIDGDSSNESGQDATLVYEQWPSTTGRNRDMIERPIHFDPAA
ncbi:hypothetical protein AB0D30_30830 [Streptomyces sp. NPDC048409]|uniref:hypothetical protein n=1 Tax=Streptomyces sp. NPDC048409 TaxID=3154723 RepID=UPI0034289989